jgi:hypothetical protein
MLAYKNIKLIAVTTESEYYDEKKNKHIKYKTPKVTKKTIFEDGYCHDLGELYEIIKFNTEKHFGYNTIIEAKFEPYNEY